MQQELIEMLEEIIQYVEVWHREADEALDRAEALIKKAKNNAPAVPQGAFLSITEGRINEIASRFRLLRNAIPFAREIEHEFRSMLAATTATPSQPAVPEIDYPELIRAAYATDKKWAQGTNGCSAFARGAEWFRDQVIAALREKQGGV